ncbi:hypothetical protein AAHC03_013684 [Spirometra sp. Aus1]
MESHSYSGLNTHGASFLQELTVDETGKDVFGKSQEQQPRPYPSFPDPQVGSYPDLSRITLFDWNMLPPTTLPPDPRTPISSYTSSCVSLHHCVDGNLK